MDGTLVGGKHISYPASIDHLRQSNYVPIMPWVTSGAHKGDNELSFFFDEACKALAYDWQFVNTSIGHVSMN